MRNDPGNRVQPGCGDLDRRRVAIAQLEDATPSCGGRIVYGLDQLHPIEGGDLADYGHGLMLGARVGGDEPRTDSLGSVVPR